MFDLIFLKNLVSVLSRKTHFLNGSQRGKLWPSYNCTYSQPAVTVHRDLADSSLLHGCGHYWM